MFSKTSLFFIFLIFGFIIYVLWQRRRIRALVAKLNDALHKKTEITNFISLFSQNLRTVEEIENSMNTTARYVADLIEAEAVCIFTVDGEYLHASGICGAFPPLHKSSSEYVLTKPRYILESLRKGKIKIGEGIIGEVAENREALFLEDATENHKLNESCTIIPVQTLMAVPLQDKGSIIGVMCAVNNRLADGAFSPEQFSRFKFIASQVVLSYNLIQVYTTLSKQQRINQELELARQLQASLLPDRFPAWEQFVVHSFTRSAKEVSGDFYDFVQLDDNRMLLVVGDACGKGIPACMIMSMTRSFIRTSIKRFTTLETFLVELNENLFRDTDEEQFITLGCCLLDKKESTVEYARAGHTSLIVYVHNHIRQIYPEGSALGLLPSELSNFDTISFTFQPEMSLLLFTDGISEALNSKEEEYGVARLCDVVKQSCDQKGNLDKIIDDILTSVDEFVESGVPQADDQTLLLIQHL